MVREGQGLDWIRNMDSKRKGREGTRWVLSWGDLGSTEQSFENRDTI